MDENETASLIARLYCLEAMTIHLVWALSNASPNPQAALAALIEPPEEKIAEMKRTRPDLNQAAIAEAQRNIASIKKALAQTLAAEI